MQIAFSAVALLMLASSVPVDVGKFNAGDFPDLITLERRMPHAEMVRRVEQIFEKRECRMDGQSKARFDLTVPFVALMGQGGSLKRVVVKEMGCAPLEKLVGQIVAAQADRGDFPVKHSSGERWYASEINFAKLDPTQALASNDPDKMICKKQEPVLGTRLKFARMCKSAAEWKAYEADREQARRDLNNTVCRPGAGTC
jgi:hypothetical protein